MPVSVKVGGAWKAAAAVYNKVGGVWKTAADMPVKVGGVWKTGILEMGSFESIATISPSTGTTSVTFSSIPSTYKSLQIRAITKFSQTSSADYTDILMALNGNALTKSHMILGNGTTISGPNSTQTVGVSINNHSSLTSNFNPTIIDIIDYASTAKNKTIRSISGMDANAYPRLLTFNSAFLSGTAAVTSITLTNASAISWITGTSFALYGIK